jgi:FkbM family methyltransferase
METSLQERKSEENNMTELIKHEPSGLWVRGDADIGVIAQQKDYKLLTTLGLVKPKILDLGGYIGTFVWFAKKNLDPEWIVSVEPDPRNAEVWEVNWGNDNQCLQIKMAVTKNGGEILPLYLGKTYASCNSLEHFRGRTTVDVHTVAFSNLLERNPTLIKCDIEGGEFGLDWSALPDSVEAIAMEIHQQRPQWIDQMKIIDQQLLDQGFNHVRKPKHELTFHKVDIGVWTRYNDRDF